jgi:hypothetical protein
VAQAVDASAIERLLHRKQAVARSGSPLTPAYWERPNAPAELAKALSRIQARVIEASALLDLDDAKAPLRTPQSKQRLLELLTRDVDTLSADSAWELANALKRELLLLGDRHYVWAQLDYEAGREKKPGRWHGWTDHFSEEKLQELLTAGTNGTVSADVQAEAVHHLRVLYQERAEAGLERRVRAGVKCRYLTILAAVLVVLFLGLSAIVQKIGGGGMWESIVLVGCAGALGATLAGTFRVRDELVELDDLRSFRPAMRVQPLVGAVAGLVILLVLESGAVALGNGNTSSWAAQALLAFTAGFSEPFFLGVVQKVAVIPDKQTGDSKK